MPVKDCPRVSSSPSIQTVRRVAVVRCGGGLRVNVNVVREGAARSRQERELVLLFGRSRTLDQDVIEQDYILARLLAGIAGARNDTQP